MRNIVVFSLVAFSTVAMSVYAQERAASGVMETQMTWSALSGMVKGVDGRVDTVVIRVDQSETCGKKGMVYAPGVAGRDADGCIHSVTNPSTINTINSISNSIKNMGTCGAAGQTYNEATNSCVKTASSCRLQGRAARGVCGAGEILVDQYYHTPDFGYVVGGTCLSVVCN